MVHTLRVLLVVLSAIGLLFVLNALRPPTLTPLIVPCFFAAWLTVELAPQLLVLTVVGVALTAWFSSVTWLGLLLSALVVIGLGWLAAQAHQVEAIADVALQEWPEVGPSEAHTPSLVRRFFRPMAFKDAQVERTKDIAYGEAGSRNHLDVYRRKDHPTAAPVLLQVHGGAWVIGTKDQQGRPLMLEMARRGWVCVAPNYRLSPRATWPDHVVDVKRALAWVKENVEQYGGDPGFVVITGGSAGGHLSSLVALSANDPDFQPGFEDVDTTVQGCVPYYGVYDLELETGTKSAKVRHDMLTRMVMKTKDEETFRRAAPIARVHADAPPFLVIHGRNDTLVPVQEARLLVQRLRETSPGPVLYLELPGTQHAFDVFPSVRSDAVVRAVARFLEALRATAPARG
jgi:acetyl esterase/lipase